MSDAFLGHARNASGPATSIFAISPDDATDLPQVTTSLNVATPGTIRVTTLDGSVGDIRVEAGRAIAVRASRVWLTGTTATGIHGLV